MRFRSQLAYRSSTSSWAYGRRRLFRGGRADDARATLRGTRLPGGATVRQHRGRATFRRSSEPGNIGELLAACGKTSSRSGVRHRAAIALLYRTGMLPWGLLALELPDFDLTSERETVSVGTGPAG